MKFSKDKKKRAIEKRLWNLIIEIAVRRSKKCEFAGCKKDGAQRDHCFSSMVSALRFDHRNITNLCAGHHTQKTFCVNGAEKVIDAVVREREGEAWWREAMSISQSKAPFKWTLLGLEIEEKQLKKVLKQAKA